MRITAELVSNLFGGSAGSSAGAADAASGLLALKLAQAKGATEKGIARERKDPVTITALKQFDQAIARAKDVKSALQDPRVLAVLLPGLGLSDQMAYPGLVQKALLADPADPKGLLASLDPRFTAAAKTLDLHSKGLAGLKNAALRKTLTDGYVQYQYQTGLDATNPGISDALYFLKTAKGETNIYNILGNSVLRRVVTGALGLPNAMVVQSVETQARAVTSRLKLTDLQDPKKLQQLAERYVIAAAGSSTGSGGSSILSLLA
ncbi:DUF1217 domain-containing protein [Paeniroseomonas aquatica]|uniref:DUF1217 domain-containing protein n=1 Tax=Paeniroseomonas aquatica TaxID=373043 RepID=A0ABT8A8X6_9PROT|nr:DUF1217 domain-containing protein [Paeniroseomonas aquatica]MDN3566257.1 DUF1217 domain-containing protein [Paeniroseomonas aquatica]